MRNKFLAFFFCFLFLSYFQCCFSKEWKRAYMASYPRSGNHWIRYLVEEASHIATGSVYLDKEPQHMNKIFPWGGYCCDHGYEGQCRYPTKNDLVFIKTHFPAQGNKITEFDQLPYEVTLRIVRHPLDSFYSRYVRRPEGPLLNKVPSERIKSFIRTWRKFQTYWNNKQNVITIRYEDVLNNPSVELNKILEVLNYSFTDEDIARAVNLHPPEGFMLKHLDKFEREDLKLIADELGDLMHQFNYEIPL